MEEMTTNDRNCMADFKGIKKKNEKEQKQINLK